ncbi:hypothetical protein XENOCAPTIV_022755, partial [Xenoophorus captivus]
QSLDTNRENPNEKNPKHLKPSNPQPVNKYPNLMAPVVVEMDQSDSGRNEPQQNMRDPVTDLSTNTSPQKHSADVGQLMEKFSGSDANLQITANDDSDGLNRTCHSEMDLNHIRGASDVQQSDSSIKAETYSVSTESGASNESSDLESADFFVEDAQTEEEEQKLLSHLQMNGSFDANRSLSENLGKQINTSQAFALDESMNDLSLTTKKRTTRGVCDGDEETDGEQPIQSIQERPFRVPGSSTPKSAPSGSCAHHVTKTVGGNTADVSHHSLLQSTMKNINAQDEEEDSKYELEEDEESQDESEWESGEDSEQDQSEEIRADRTREEGSEQQETQEGELQMEDFKEHEEVEEESEREKIQEYETLESGAEEELKKKKSAKEMEEGDLQVKESEKIQKEEVQDNDPQEEKTREESVEKTQVEASKEEKKSEETVVEEDETREWKSGEDSVSQEEESEKEEFEERLKEDVQENNLGEDDPRKKKTEGEEEEEEDVKETRGSFKSTLINTSPNLQVKPSGLGQPLETHSSQKKPQHLKPDPSHPQQDNFNTAPNAEMVRPGSGAEELWLNLSEQVMDLTLNASPQQHSVDVGEPMDKTSERVANLLLISADDCSGLNRTSHSKIDIDYISRRFSELQELDFSFKSEQSKECAEFESSHGNFVLQLEDSYDVLEESEAEEWEQELVSELQNRDVDVSKSLSDSLQKRTINSCQASGSDRSSNKHQEEIPHIKSPNDDSSQLFGSTTPGSDSSGTSSHHLRNSAGGSLPEVPQISILQSITNSIDAQDLKEEHEDSKDDDGSYVPQKNIVTLICKEPQSEEANNTREEEDDVGHKSTLEKTSILEEEEDEEDNNDADGELNMNSNDGDISELNSEESVGEDVTRLNSNGPPLDGGEGGFEEDKMQEKGSEEEETEEKSDKEEIQEEEVKDDREEVSEKKDTHEDETWEWESEEEREEERSDKEENRDSASEEDKEMLKEEVQDCNLEKEETEDESGRKKAVDESWELESEEKETQEEVSKKKESGEVEMQKDETQEVEFDKEKMQKRDEQMEEFEEAEKMLQESGE